MSTMTLSGREAPSISTSKRIDVEANLLEEWLLERQQLRKQIQAKLMLIAAVAIVGFAGMAELNKAKAGYAAKQAPLKQRLKAVQAQYGELMSKQQAESPNAEFQKFGELAKSHSDAYMAQLISLLNSTPASVAMSSLKVDVLGGEMKLSGQADAETDFAADDFIRGNNDTSKGMNTVRISTSRSDVLAQDGVSFQFVKKVKVAQ